jgi:hypothetical protein
VRDARGIRFLAQLLWQPYQQLHAVELVASSAPGTTDRAALPAVADACAVRLGLGDAGALLDARARSAYRKRIEQLEGELCEAEARHDLGAMDRLRREADFLTTELREATRGRRAADHAERARLAVTKAVKSALHRLAAVHPRLVAQLQANGAAGVPLGVHARPAYADRVVARVRTGVRRRQILDGQRAIALRANIHSWWGRLRLALAALVALHLTIARTGSAACQSTCAAQLDLGTGVPSRCTHLPM